MTWFAVNIMRSKYGRAFIAIRDNDRAAEGMGIPIFKYKLLSFAISSFYAGFAGALWAYYMVSITAEPFNLGLSVEYIAMVIIGGMGNIPGAIFGATFITLLNELLRYYRFADEYGHCNQFRFKYGAAERICFRLIHRFIYFIGTTRHCRIMENNAFQFPALAVFLVIKG